MFSMEFCGGATGTCPWCHLEGGLSSRGTSLMSGGRDQDSDSSGPTWTRERHHPADISKKISMSILQLSLYIMHLSFHIYLLLLVLLRIWLLIVLPS
jgi:hypothetical protein